MIIDIKNYDRQLIGRGGFGEVFLLTKKDGHFGDDEKMALKVMRCMNTDERMRFEKECETLEQLIHSNIVNYKGQPLVDASSSIFNFGILMEYCERGSLEQVIFESTIIYSMRTVHRWTRQLFSALHFIFDYKHIIHRDIKPTNIFVTRAFTLKLGDFGSVKEMEMTCSGTFVGTRRYMSPPVLNENEPDDHSQLKVSPYGQVGSHKNDVYSLGLVLWEIIERRSVFSKYLRNERFLENLLFSDIESRQPTGLEELECPGQFRDLIHCCIKFVRSARPIASHVLDQLTQMRKDFDQFDEMPIIESAQANLLRPIGFDGSIERISIRRTRDTSDQAISPSPLDLDRETAKGGRSSSETLLRGRVRDLREVYERLDRLSPQDKQAFFQKVPDTIEAILGKKYFMHSSMAWLLSEITPFEKSERIDERFIGLLMNDVESQISELQQIRHDFVSVSFDQIILPCKPIQMIQLSLRKLVTIRNTSYYARLYAECWISSNTGKRWLFWDYDVTKRQGIFVSKDWSSELRAVYRFEPSTRMETYCRVDSPATTWSRVDPKNVGTNEKLFYFGDQPIDLDEIFEVCQEKLLNEDRRLYGLFSRYVFLDYAMERSDHISALYPGLGTTLPLPGYIFQLRNPPRTSCRHGIVSCKQRCYAGFEMQNITEKLRKRSPFYFYECTGLESYDRHLHEMLGLIGGAFSNQGGLGFLDYEKIAEYGKIFDFSLSWHDEVFNFLVIPNICDRGAEYPLILLDHPINYREDEKILCIDINKMIYEILAETVSTILDRTPVNEQLFVEMRRMEMRRRGVYEETRPPNQDQLIACRFFRYGEICKSSQGQTTTLRPLKPDETLVIYEYPEEKARPVPRWHWEID